MRFGICTDIKNISITQGLGYDYIEPNASKVASLTDGEFNELYCLVKNADIKCECFNVLFPWEFSLFGEGAATIRQITEYLKHLLGRVGKLGGELIVFGSGKPRRYPSDMKLSEVYSRFVQIARCVADLAGEFGLEIAFEPLCANETNLANRIEQGDMLVRMVDRQNFRLLADWYHMCMSGDGVESLQPAKRLGHTHFAMSDGRVYPKTAAGEVENFVLSLYRGGYDGRLSIEGNTKDFKTDAAAAICALRAVRYDLV